MFTRVHVCMRTRMHASKRAGTGVCAMHARKRAGIARVCVCVWYVGVCACKK